MHDAQNKQVDKLSAYVCTAYEGRKRGEQREMGGASSIFLLLLLEGDFSIFNLASCLPALFPLLPRFPSVYTAHICCGCTLQSLPSFVSFSFISASYHFPRFFSRSNGINNLFCEFPYLPYIAPVDLLGLIPFLRGIGSYGSNRVPLSPKALKIEFYPPSFFKAHFCSRLFYFFYILNAGADCVF